MIPDKDVLSSLFIFRGCDFNGLDRKYSISDNTSITSYTDRQVILSKDEKITGLAVVAKGKAVIQSYYGNDSTVIREMSRFDSFGAATIFSPDNVFTTSVISSERCTVYCIDEQKIREILASEPLCCINYITFLSERISFLNRKVSAFSAPTSDSKVAMYLIENKEPGKNEVTLRQNIVSVSEKLGIGRASFYRSLETMKSRNIISKSGKVIKILDYDELKKMI